MYYHVTFTRSPLSAHHLITNIQHIGLAMKHVQSNKVPDHTFGHHSFLPWPPSTITVFVMISTLSTALTASNMTLSLTLCHIILKSHPILTLYATGTVKWSRFSVATKKNSWKPPEARNTAPITHLWFPLMTIWMMLHIGWNTMSGTDGKLMPKKCAATHYCQPI